MAGADSWNGAIVTGPITGDPPPEGYSAEILARRAVESHPDVENPTTFKPASKKSSRRITASSCELGGYEKQGNGQFQAGQSREISVIECPSISYWTFTWAELETRKAYDSERTYFQFSYLLTVPHNVIPRNCRAPFPYSEAVSHPKPFSINSPHIGRSFVSFLRDPPNPLHRKRSAPFPLPRQLKVRCLPFPYPVSI
jgi:hypothetical protein